MSRFDSVLIANRGEIVTRVARTARALGHKTIAVASAVDARAPHTEACDAVVPIGGERPADSYLRIDRLLEAARVSGAQAVHPGYGFLSENASFAQAVIDAGLVWIGPPPGAMLAMADKANARQRLSAAGVPVLPGYDGEDQQRDTLRFEAGRIGLPLMIKATAGGGGRGMRLVTQTNELDAALDSAAAEAEAAFGNPRLLMERALLAPRHVEIQIFADTLGAVLHLGERDCSVQRRHQKIIEEAPSPAVSAALRRRMGEVAVTVARAGAYDGAGTVEFLLDESGEFWFMEMNTRLQVEHPVTEALVGVDLVEWQLRVAAGEALPLTQDEVLQRFESGGHAIEARLCAEDPAHGYLPQSGRILHWQPPRSVRCDHALASGCDVSPFYDSMLAKLIAHAPSRAEATHKLADALDRSVCLGVTTNRAFLASVLRHPAFAGSAVTTAFLGLHFGDDLARAGGAPSWLRALAAASNATLGHAVLPALWAGWTSSNRVDTISPIGTGETTEAWRLDGTLQSLTARCGEHVHHITGLVRESRSLVHAVIDGHPVSARCVQDGGTGWWQSDGFEMRLQDLRLAAPEASMNAKAGALRAPMHGRVTQVHTAPGDRVEAGALLIVMEAMKMEHQVHAPFAGTVGALHASVGEQVAARQLLVEVGP
ncbi:MAG: biotin carboxylase N-terminal domain-containing protein [Burkholderiales bacterium]|nr:biotin carboxylase N-terminal domain-containing protein [Burkholderiales bacterium]